VQTTYLVDGMTCDHCVRAVTEELSAVPGVESVSVDLTVGGPTPVLVTSGAPLDTDAVGAAVAEAGYSLHDQP
jgi:copper chaperone CopZ